MTKWNKMNGKTLKNCRQLLGRQGKIPRNFRRKIYELLKVCLTFARQIGALTHITLKSCSRLDGRSDAVYVAVSLGCATLLCWIRITFVIWIVSFLLFGLGWWVRCVHLPSKSTQQAHQCCMEIFWRSGGILQKWAEITILIVSLGKSWEMKKVGEWRKWGNEGSSGIKEVR